MDAWVVVRCSLRRYLMFSFLFRGAAGSRIKSEEVAWVLRLLSERNVSVCFFMVAGQGEMVAFFLSVALQVSRPLWLQEDSDGVALNISAS